MPEKEVPNKKAIQRNNFGTLSWVDRWIMHDFSGNMGPKIFSIEICKIWFCFGGNWWVFAIITNRT